MKPWARHAAVVCVFGVAAAAATPAAAGAVTVYRCGAAGNIYSQLPCPGGTAFAIDDGRTPQERADAMHIAQADQLRAERMQVERLRNERRQTPAAAGSLGACSAAPGVIAARSRTTGAQAAQTAQTAQAAQATRGARRARSEDGDFIAYSPSPKKKRGR